LTKIAELHITPVRGRGIAFILSFPTPDQVEGDTKDTVYQTSEISSILSFPIHRESPLIFMI